MVSMEERTLEERALRRAKYLSGLVWHIGAFVIINAFFWILDSLGGGGINWAIWITVMWGIGLAFHVLAYLVDGRQLEEQKAEQYIEEFRARTSSR